ncbi:O-antigen ligase domain-containing protein, partial [Francisella tularensis subsp. holarctica]|nr:O-antigen ligase domain-containing protein [Francisella tularensis subsp. holarctica]
QCIFVKMLTAGMIVGMLNAMYKTYLGLIGWFFVFVFCLSIFVKQPQQDNIVSSTSYAIFGFYIFSSIICIAILQLIFP